MLQPLLFFVGDMTYMIHSQSYIPIDVITRDSNKEEPLIYKDSPYSL